MVASRASNSKGYEELILEAAHRHDLDGVRKALERAYDFHLQYGDRRLATRLALLLAVDIDQLEREPTSASAWLVQACNLNQGLNQPLQLANQALAGSRQALLRRNVGIAQRLASEALALGRQFKQPEIERAALALLRQTATGELPSTDQPAMAPVRRRFGTVAATVALCLMLVVAVLILMVNVIAATRPGSERNAEQPPFLATAVVIVSSGWPAATAEATMPAASPPRAERPAVATPPATVSTPTATILPLVQRAITAEASLRSGEIEAVIDYGGVTQSSARLRFDLGDNGQPARLHSVVTYTTTKQIQITERLIIGERWWQRLPDGRWTPIPAEEEITGQLQGLLPHLTDQTATQIETASGTTTLRWYDASRDADLSLSVDPATGTPRQLRQTARNSKATLTVTYSGWNITVDLKPPANTQALVPLLFKSL